MWFQILFPCYLRLKKSLKGFSRDPLDRIFEVVPISSILRMTQSFKKIPIYQPNLAGNEKRYVQDCLESSWISSKGDYIARFEAAFTKFTGHRHSVSVSNGTVALHV